MVSDENEGVEDDRVGTTTSTRSYPTELVVGNSTDEGNNINSGAFAVPGKDKSRDVESAGKVLESEDGKKKNSNDAKAYGIPGAKVADNEVSFLVEKGGGMIALVMRSSSEDQTERHNAEVSPVSNELEMKELAERLRQDKDAAINNQATKQTTNNATVFVPVVRQHN